MFNNNRKQKEQTEQRNYVIRPVLKEKFKKNRVQEIITKSLEDNLKDVQYNAETIITLNKTICDEVKNKLKEDSMNFKRYKILVHCIIGEKRGQGIRIGSKCLWDSNCDSSVSASYENPYLFAFCSTYGVYFY